MPRLRSFLSALKPTRLGVLVAVLVGLGVGFWQWLQPPRPRVVLEKVGGKIALRPFFCPDGQGLVIFHRCDTPNGDFFDLTLWDAPEMAKRNSTMLGLIQICSILWMGLFFLQMEEPWPACSKNVLTSSNSRPME
jgi:hypothetical protein